MKRLLLLFGGLLIACQNLLAQPVLVKDMTPGANGSELSSFATVNGTLYFLKQPNGTSPALWKSDGTEAGTVIIREFASISDLSTVNNVLYFSANDGVYGRELWKSDGTAAGTVLVKDLFPGGAFNSSDPSNFTNVNGTLYFTTDQGLWKSDGTAAGTVLVKQGISTNHLTNLNGSLYFVLFQNAEYWLYKSDGTAAGTVPVQQITYSSFNQQSGTVHFLTTVNDTLYAVHSYLYRIPVPMSGIYKYYNLLKSDGTAAGTTSSVVIESASQYSTLLSHVAVANNLYFTILSSPSSQVLYKTNLVNGATANVTNLTVNSTSADQLNPDLTNVNGTLFFNARRDDKGFELWKSDGTEAGTVLVQDINPGTGSSYPANLTNVNGVLYFSANNGINGTELWKYDPSATPAGNTSFRINAGGSTYTSTDGKVFSADGYFTGGQAATPNPNVAIANTVEDTLYRSERWGEFNYRLPVANGNYKVTLHFAEIYFGTTYQGQPVGGGAGSRKFNVDIEGERKLTEFDIFAEVGGALKATYRIYQVKVSDGILNLDFIKGSANFPKVSAIEVTPVYTSLKINAGGPAYTGSEVPFSADMFFTGGNAAETTGEVANTNNDVLYRSERWGEFSYDLPVANGNYKVILHFNEFYFGNIAPGGMGSRRFNVDIEGVRRLTEYDILAKTGEPMKATQESLPVTVSDGILNINFVKGSANFPKISAIEVIYAPSSGTSGGGVAARMAASGTLEQFKAELRPNPADDYSEVKLSIPASQVRSTVVSSANGKVMLLNTHRIVDENTLRLDVSGLRTGLYLLKVDTQSGTQVLKLVKQ